MRDKFIALDQDKCQFVYQLLRATNAKNVVEIGTSFGVSTIYFALAVGSNIEASGGEGKVIATEKEPSKAEKAKAYWKEAGDELVTRHIDLRVGDLIETLKNDLPAVDLVLLDSRLFPTPGSTDMRSFANYLSLGAGGIACSEAFRTEIENWCCCFGR